MNQNIVYVYRMTNQISLCFKEKYKKLQNERNRLNSYLRVTMIVGFMAKPWISLFCLHFSDYWSEWFICMISVAICPGLKRIRIE